jgi:CheY-like chemotaxis protein
MASSRATDVLPIAIVSNDAVKKGELSHFRTGAVAVIARGSGADTIARRVAELTEEIPERAGVATGRVSEENLHELVQLAASDAKTGILSIRAGAGAGEQADMSMLVEPDCQSAEDLDAMLNKLRDALEQKTELQYEFHEASGGRLSIVPAGSGQSTSDLSSLRNTRIVVLDVDLLRAERLSEVLVQNGVYGAAADMSLAGLPRIREIDPQIIIVDASTIRAGGLDVVRAMRKDAQLQWASILVVRWEELWPARASRPDLGQLAARIELLIEQDAELRRRTVDEIDFDTRLELVGPGRLIRALCAVPGVRHVVVSSTRGQVEIDIADAAVLGAYVTYTDRRREAEQGMPALVALWNLNAGRVAVREQDLPSVANIMMSVDEALGMVALALSGGADASHAVRAETVRPLQASTTGGGTFEEPPTTKSRVAKVHTEQVVLPPPSLSAGPSDGQPPAEAGASERGLEEQIEEQAKEVSTAPHPLVAADVEARTIPVGRGPKPPPPTPRRAPRVASETTAGDEAPTQIRDRQSDVELARVLEGGTIAAPAPTKSRGWMPLAAAVGLLSAALLLWIQLQTPKPSPAAKSETALESPKGPLTGPVDGAEGARSKSQPARNEAEAFAAEELAGAPEGTEAEPAPPKSAESKSEASRKLDIPTRNLPKDPARASDVLVYRALPMIRKSELLRAEATLDRAWELDPQNPQAMAGYARLFLAKEEAERAVKWATRAVSRRPKRSAYHVLLGDALQMDGDIAGARRAWRNALSVDRRNRTARARLAATQSVSEDNESQAVEATASASRSSK